MLKIILTVEAKNGIFLQELTFTPTLGFPTCVLYHRLFSVINLFILVTRVKGPMGNIAKSTHAQRLGPELALTHSFITYLWSRYLRSRTGLDAGDIICTWT